ncbi:MAG TPA: molybdopterin oxidoreductase, partial [Polyangiaceae bacterium]
MKALENRRIASALTRRCFIQSLGGLASAAGLPACRRPEEPMVGYVKQPQDSLPGVPLHYATCLVRHDNAFGIIVECNDGHPTKIEGNPRHPESLGGTTAAVQACLYDLYDQDRSHGPMERGQSRTWAEASAMLLELGRRLATDEGASFAILYDAHRSPTLASALTRLKRRLPKLRMVRCDGSEPNQARLGAALAFDSPVETLVDWHRV